jgi:hypothetical protein
MAQMRGHNSQEDPYGELDGVPAGKKKKGAKRIPLPMAKHTFDRIIYPV